MTLRGRLHVRFDFYAAGLDLPWKEKLFKFHGIFFSNKAMLFCACHFHTFNKQARRLSLITINVWKVFRNWSHCLKRSLNTYQGTCKESSYTEYFRKFGYQEQINVTVTDHERSKTQAEQHRYPRLTSELRNRNIIRVCMENLSIVI